jgi:hypothetical protein
VGSDKFRRPIPEGVGQTGGQTLWHTIARGKR